MKKIIVVFVTLMLTVSLFAKPVTIDVMIVYDNSATNYLSQASLSQEDFARSLINRLETAYDNSGLELDFNYVHHLAIDYDTLTDNAGNNIGADLGNVAKNPTVLAARETHHADLVQMVVNINHPTDRTWSWVAGIAYQYAPSNSLFDFKPYGYSVVSIQDIITGISGTSAHEIGHNLGASHDPKNQSHNPTVSYGQGYLYSDKNGSTYHTVMAYSTNGEKESPYFSTPCKEYPNGTAVGIAGQYDNTRAISNAMGVIASFYGVEQTNDAVTIDICPPSYTITVETPISNGQVNCPTTATPGDEVTCKAIPEADFTLSAWSGACEDTPKTELICQFIANGDVTVGATFTEQGIPENYIFYSSFE